MGNRHTGIRQDDIVDQGPSLSSLPIDNFEGTHHPRSIDNRVEISASLLAQQSEILNTDEIVTGTTRMSTTSVTQQQAKVEGEVVNDVTRLRAVLETNWDINRKVVGNWYLLLWPPQTLIWWAVDYNKEEALGMLLDYAFRQVDRSPEDRRRYYEQLKTTLESAERWTIRKALERMRSALELALTRLESEASQHVESHSQEDFPHRFSVEEDDDSDEDEDDRRRRLRSSSTATVYSQSPDGVDINDVEDVLKDLVSACAAQSKALSRAERVRVETALQLDVVAAELAAKEHVLNEKAHAASLAEASFTEAAEHLEAARVFMMAAEDSFIKRRDIVERARKENETLKGEVEALLHKRDALSYKAHRLEEGVASVLVSPLQVVEYVQHGPTTLDKLGGASSSCSMDDPDPLECPICRDERISKNLQCGHAFCSGCVKRVHELASMGGASMMSFSFTDNKLAPRCPLCKAVIETVHPLFIA